MKRFSKSISNEENYSKYILIYKYQAKYYYLKNDKLLKIKYFLFVKLKKI